MCVYILTYHMLICKSYTDFIEPSINNFNIILFINNADIIKTVGYNVYTLY
jgi:hypothetical protein